MTTERTDAIPGVNAVARLWARKGQRHQAYRCLVGGLLRAGWPVERVEALVSQLAEATNDEEATARVRIVTDTAARLAKDEPVIGWPRLAELLGAEKALSIRLALDCALTVDALAAAKKLPAGFLRELGIADADEDAGHVLIPYRDAAGKTVAVRKRCSLGSKPRWEKGAKALPYGEDKLADAVETGYLILVEGESDCWCCWHTGFSSLGIPGAECARALQIGHVDPFKRIFLVQEADGAGERFVDGVARRLAELGWAGELLIIPMSEKRKDVSALHIAAPEKFKARWQTRMDKAEALDLPSTDPISTTPAPLPYQPFPVDALPGPLAAFVRQGAAALGCDASFFALPALTVAAAMIGNSRSIRLKRDWTEPSVLWSAVVGDSGTLKSPAMRLALRPVYRLQGELRAQYKEAKAAFDAVKSEYERAVRQARKDGKPPDEAMPEPPLPGHCFTTDTTIEGLCRLLADNPRGLLASRDELRGWFHNFTRYKGQSGGSDLSAWLELFRAETVKIDRKSAECPTLFIPRAAVSVCGTIQPGTLARALTPETFEAGLAARLLVAMPPKLPKRWTDAEIDAEVHQRYETVLRQLFNIKLDTDERGEPEPFALKLTPQARSAWVKFFDEWAEKQTEAEGERAACLSKLEGYAARFALIHHVVTRVAAGADDSDPVDLASIEAGVTLARWFADEAQRVYTVCRSSDEERQTRRLVEYVRGRGGEVTARMLHRSNPARFRTTEEAEAALDELAKRGMGVWMDTSPGPKGGRPSRVFRLSPHLTQPKPDTTSEGVNGAPDETLDDTSRALAKPGENGVVSGFGCVNGDSDEKGAPDAAGGSVRRRNGDGADKVDSIDKDDEGEGEMIL